jgi:hypothetical protein
MEQLVSLSFNSFRNLSIKHVTSCTPYHRDKGPHNPCPPLSKHLSEYVSHHPILHNSRMTLMQTLRQGILESLSSSLLNNSLPLKRALKLAYYAGVTLRPNHRGEFITCNSWVHGFLLELGVPVCCYL